MDVVAGRVRRAATILLQPGPRLLCATFVVTLAVASAGHWWRAAGDAAPRTPPPAPVHAAPVAPVAHADHTVVARAPAVATGRRDRGHPGARAHVPHGQLPADGRPGEPDRAPVVPADPQSPFGADVVDAAPVEVDDRWFDRAEVGDRLEWPLPDGSRLALHVDQVDADPARGRRGIRVVGADGEISGRFTRAGDALHGTLFTPDGNYTIERSAGQVWQASHYWFNLRHTPGLDDMRPIPGGVQRG